jgi:hypothetical protein
VWGAHLVINAGCRKALGEPRSAAIEAQEPQLGACPREDEKKEQGRSPARKIVSTLYPRMFGFILD